MLYHLFIRMGLLCTQVMQILKQYGWLGGDENSYKVCLQHSELGTQIEKPYISPKNINVNAYFGKLVKYTFFAICYSHLKHKGTGCEQVQVLMVVLRLVILQPETLITF